MGDFFGDLRSGIRMPQVVMNQGPLPGSGGLPQPLHETADGRINYNSSLLGELTPYAYGEPGYLSSQTAYLNIPHKIQKIIPVVFLPEAKEGATDFFDLSHPVDDGDLAFAMRLDRSSLFCTGLKNGDMRRAGLGTAVDPLINLATVNYILSGVQLGIPDTEVKLSGGNLWTELLFNLDRVRFGKRQGFDGRDYATKPIDFADILHIARHCIRPFGITRGSERQGGQNEATASPATWPVSFVASITLDGKESNVMNLWHNMSLSAGDDLVLRLKLMPVYPYTLNHYYKGVKRQSWKLDGPARFIWQLVPDVMSLDGPTLEDEDVLTARLATLLPRFKQLRLRGGREVTILGSTPWQDLGFWHIGRTQVMSSKYGVEEYWHNDLANSLRTNHLDITLQPYFQALPRHKPRIARGPFDSFGGLAEPVGGGWDEHTWEGGGWSASLGLECLPDQIGDDGPGDDFGWGLGAPSQPDGARSQSDRDDFGWVSQPDRDDFGWGLGARSQPDGARSQPDRDDFGWVSQPDGAPSQPDAPAKAPVREEDDPLWIGTLDFTEPLAPPEPQAAEGDPKRASVGKGAKRRSGAAGGSLLKADGTSVSSAMHML
jgi:hypothetical protein